MSRSHAPVQPHGDIGELARGIYWVRGSVKMGPGMRVSRNMTVIESDGALTLVNAVRLDDRGEARLTELGAVTHVVKLGYFHGMDDAYYVDTFEAAYWALPGGTRRREPTPSETLSKDHLPCADMELFAFEHARKPEGALLVARGGGVLVTCDAVQNWPDTTGCSVPAKLVTRAMGFAKRPAQIGPPWHKFMTPKGSSLRPDFERLAALEFEQLISAHGGPLTSGARAALAATVAAKFG